MLLPQLMRPRSRRCWMVSRSQRLVRRFSVWKPLPPLKATWDIMGPFLRRNLISQNHKPNFFLAWGAHLSSHNNHTLTRCGQDFAVKLPRKLIDDLKNTAGGIAATGWMLAAAGRYGKVMEVHLGGWPKVILGSLKCVPYMKALAFKGDL